MQTFPLTPIFLMLFLALGIDSASINNTVHASTPNSNLTLVQPFIVGGEEATKNEFPFLVRLTIRKNGKSFLCGGALIKLDLVLSASHCVNGTAAGNIDVYAGDHDKTITESTEQMLTGRAIKMHEEYDSNDTHGELNDIALIKLNGVFNQTDYVRPINLPEAKSEITARYGVIVGWGRLWTNGILPKVVMKVVVPIVPNNEFSCGSQVRDNNTQFCAGDSETDSCQGDSGGPLVCKNSAGYDEVCGIVSYGLHGCADLYYPGVYTKVSSYIDWINKHNVEDEIADTKPPGSVNGILVVVTILAIFVAYVCVKAVTRC